MTEYQLQAAQAAIDCMTAVAPIALVLAIGASIIRYALKFITGRRI